MTRLGEAHGVRTAAMITAMDTALGRAVGNAVEVRQAVDELGGCGPGDVRDLAIAECEAMLRLAGAAGIPPKPSPTVVPWTSSATLSSSPVTGAVDHIRPFSLRSSPRLGDVPPGQALMNSSRSALMVSAWVVGMPCGKPR